MDEVLRTILGGGILFLLFALGPLLAIGLFSLTTVLLKKDFRSHVYLLLAFFSFIITGLLASMIFSGDSLSWLMAFTPSGWVLMFSPVIFSVIAVIFLNKALISFLKDRAPKLHSSLSQSAVLRIGFWLFVIIPILLLPLLAVSWFGYI